MKFDMREFRSFVKTLQVETKEMGLVSLGEAWSGTQEYFIQEVAKGLEEDCHYFVVLKGRQVMISTVCLALDLYWAFKYPGTGATLIADSEENRDMFRTTLTMYTESLPNKWKQPIRGHNRTQMVIGNRSRIAYQVVGTKRKDRRSVGVGKAIMMMHATEVANWGDENALADIEASLAESNPKRLFIYESTARGYNHFEEMWQTAKRARSQRAIFIGWWRNELYRKKKGSAEHRVYWNGELTKAEAQWVGEIKTLYDFDIDEEQIAWWRWKFEENIREESRMLENYPPTEEYAFQMSGSKFFLSANLSDRMKIAKAKPFDCFRFVFSDSFAETKLVDAHKDFAQLKVWQPPVKNAYYAVGGDPAYGSSDWADRFCLSQDTELLTKDGWKTYNQIKIGDLAACFDLKSENYSFEKVQDVIVKDHDGPMMQFKSRSFDCLATPEHRFVAKLSQNATGRRKLYPWCFRRADDLPRHFRVPLGSAPCGIGVAGLSLDMCRVLGWMATDGHHERRPPNTGKRKRKWIGGLHLAQATTTNKRGVNISQEMTRVLLDMFRTSPVVKAGGKSVNRKDGRTLNHSETLLWYIKVKQAEKILSWFDGDIHRIPHHMIERASKPQLEALFLGLMEGDGTSQNGEWTKFYPGYSHGLADDLQEITIRLGYSASKSINPSNSQVVVHIARRPWHYIRKREKVDYKGQVWCITVPTGAFVARRNGRVFVTGNCAQVYRLWADGMEQVAEYCTAEGDTTQFAWVLLYLSGAYTNPAMQANVMLNLEINGPGINVWSEIQNMKRLVGTNIGLTSEIAHVLINLQNYLYKRPDSISGSYAWHFKTDHHSKERLMNCYKDGFERGLIVVNSSDCLDEMKKVQRDDGDISVPGRGKDDRVIASGLCAIAWHDFMRLRLAQTNVSRLRATERSDDGQPVSAVARTTMNYLHKIGIVDPNNAVH